MIVKSVGEELRFGAQFSFGYFFFSNLVGEHHYYGISSMMIIDESPSAFKNCETEV